MQYKKIYALFFIIISTYSFSQTNMERDLNNTNEEDIEVELDDDTDWIEMEEGDSNRPFISVEQMPIFGDCKDEACTQSEIMKFIARNFIYPEIAKANGVEGRVIIEFVVEKDGTVGRVKILIGVDSNLYRNLSIEEEKNLEKNWI